MSVDNVKIWHHMMNINLVVSFVTAKSPNLIFLDIRYNTYIQYVWKDTQGMDPFNETLRTKLRCSI